MSANPLPARVSFCSIGERRRNFTQGKQIVAEFTDSTTNDAIEGALKRYVQFAEGQGENLTDEQLSTIRSGIVTQKNPLSRIPVQNCFSVTILHKTLATDSEIEPTLANLFVQNIAAVGGTVDRLVADDRAILAGSSQTWRNVLVDGKQGELSYFSINQKGLPSTTSRSASAPSSTTPSLPG